MRLPAVSPPKSRIAFFGLRSTAQMSEAARLTAGTTLPRILGTNSTMPTRAATTAIAISVVLPDESLLLPLSIDVDVMAAAMRNRPIWIAPPTPVLSTMALPADATGTSCLCR